MTDRSLILNWPGWPCAALRLAYQAMTPHEQTNFEAASWQEKRAIFHELLTAGRLRFDRRARCGVVITVPE